MTSNLEVALALKIAQTGLENITSLIRQMHDAGAATDDFEEETASLSQTMQETARKRELIDQFVTLRRATDESKNAMEAAKARTQEMALALRNTENPTQRQRQAFENARQAARDAADAYQNNRLRLQNLRGTLNESGLSTRTLNQHQRDLNNQTRALQQQYDDLRRRVEQASNELDQNADSARRAGSETDDLADQVAQARNAFLGFLGLDLGVDMLRDLSYLADGYSNLTSRIKLAVGEGDAFHQGLSDVRTTANNTGTALESVAGLYTKLYRATRDLGTS
ncbi:hypothetical protein Q8W24_09615 [Oceanobacter sp. 4_MG-2023]|nr:tape measure protein [Oceanobacter sp. 4_MG-2023]MDP2548087.1 hypothetical protein [Oceanobacter sp. 4_MG-2023]